MPDTTTQTNRHIGITTPLGADKLLLRRIQGVEGLSQLFRYELDLLSRDSKIDFDKVVGQPVSIRIDLPDDQKRYIHGYVSRFSQAIPLGELHEYKMEVVPWLWLLTRAQDCRIWQKKKAPDILQAIFSDRGFSDIELRISAGDYAEREYCVQYMETDFQFVSRLMEEEGIFYFFKHEESKHTLVLCDSNSRITEAEGFGNIPFHRPDEAALHSDSDGFHHDTIFTLLVENQVQPGKFAHTDYNFTTPQTSLLSTSEIVKKHGKADFEIFEFPGEHGVKAVGDRTARLRMEALAVPHHVVRGQTSGRALRPGANFTLTDFWRTDRNIKYLITRTELSGTVNDYDFLARENAPEFTLSFEAIPFDVPYRAPRHTPKPRIFGVQTAKVVGVDGEEIFTDNYGRVKVQFPWDRLGTSNENSSCWIRVAQTLSGPQWGGIWIPRMGMEVLVAFVSGDPDQPLVTGCVYNEDNKPPYALPDNMTQSGWKTRSTKEATDKNFNELRFEDKKGHEEVYFHAEKNMTRVVENNDVQNIGAGKQDPGDQTIEIYNDQTVTIGEGSGAGSQTLTVKKDQTITVADGNHAMEVSTGNHSTKVTAGDMDVKVDAGKITIEAGISIELKVGGSTIKIDTSSITATIGSATLKMESASAKLSVGGSSVELGPAEAKVSSPMTTVEGSGQCKVTGAMVDINGSGMVKVAGGVLMLG
jgi:type VI secretion system secreted protein VgrG